jgi:hypothetical protein
MPKAARECNSRFRQIAQLPARVDPRRSTRNIKAILGRGGLRAGSAALQNRLFSAT